MMDNSKVNSFDNLDMERWLESFFLDPHTSFLDQSQFRIDIFETSTYFIIEALLMDYDASNLFVNVKNGTIIIKAKNEYNSVKERKVELPLQLNQKKIKAFFSNGILEVFIHKNKGTKQGNRSLKIK